MNRHHLQTRPDYDTDFYAWTQHQAKMLRGLRVEEHQLPGELDLAQLAEEIEDLGKAELHAVTSLIQQILVHLIKMVSAPGAQSVPHWRAEAVAFSVSLRRRYVPSMRQNVDMAELWADGLEIAEAQLQEHKDALAPDLPRSCPLTLDYIEAKDFRFDEALARLRDALHP